MLSRDSQGDGGREPDANSEKKKTEIHKMNMNIYSYYQSARQNANLAPGPYGVPVYINELYVLGAAQRE